MEILIAVIAAIVGLGLGGVVSYLLRHRVAQSRIQTAEADALRMISEAEAKSKGILLEAKDEVIRLRNQVEVELRERRSEIQRQERRLNQKEENLERKLEALERRERNLANKEKELEAIRNQAEQIKRQQQEELQRVAGLTAAEAKKILLAEVEQEIREDANRRLRHIESEMREEAEARARKILVTAIQRVTSEVVSEATTTVVPIPSDDMKGRIIGREGRNIRALEASTGVDVIIDDTPDAVTLSCFDPVRREVARVALTNLLRDGRIHPARIEDMVEKAKKEVDAALRAAGEEAALEAECPGLHPELLYVLGRLKYRTSYGQNQLKHAVETAHLAAMLAYELGADVYVARRAGLMHDIGKALDHEVEGTHALIGAELLRRYGVSPAVVHCVAAHHEEEEPQTVEAIITMVADAISGSRPGARRESLDQYLKRLEALESLANSFAGVEKSFAIQAGREIRIIVKPKEVDDLGAMRLARDVSKKIEEALEYPGQIKVTVVRETRAIEYAK